MLRLDITRNIINSKKKRLVCEKISEKTTGFHLQTISPELLRQTSGVGMRTKAQAERLRDKF